MRTCNLTSLRFVRFSVETSVRNFVRILPNTLNKRSHDAEIAEIDRRRHANVMSSGGGLVGWRFGGWQKLRMTKTGSTYLSFVLNSMDQY